MSATTSPPLGGLYMDWGVVQISMTNLVVIAVMLAVFVLALVVPFPGHGAHRSELRDDARDGS